MTRKERQDIGDYFFFASDEELAAWEEMMRLEAIQMESGLARLGVTLSEENQCTQ